jgi:hypothetical protein
MAPFQYYDLRLVPDLLSNGKPFHWNSRSHIKEQLVSFSAWESGVQLSRPVTAESNQGRRSKLTRPLFYKCLLGANSIYGDRRHRVRLVQAFLRGRLWEFSFQHSDPVLVIP